ncbi:acetylxylan esterase [Microlunatus ginsengisoli]|uniref:Acetylxylan esterase n=1 Tax=Microlunatus ginsengisoli TaxID=363863 RepID=A0ABP7AMH1_9ACTN
MAMFDLPLAELEAYRPEIERPDDLVEFWQRTLAESRAHELELSAELVDNKLALIDTYDVGYSGFGGTSVRAWLHVPAGASGPLPTVVQYRGYSRGRGFPHSNTEFAQAGWATLVMDTRGQGWREGGPAGSDDRSIDGGVSQSPGFMTGGILRPEDYYYRRVYVDALRLVECLAFLPQVDPSRVVLTGGSQGGGITIATAGLAVLPGAELAGVRLLGAAPDVPFLCHFRRAVELTDSHPYREIALYLAGWRDHADAAYRTLSYHDGVNLGRLASCPALFSVALMDLTCPPSTVYAAYNAWGEAAPGGLPAKEIAVYPHNDHEGGEAYQYDRQLDWFGALFAAAVD